MRNPLHSYEILFGRKQARMAHNLPLTSIFYTSEDFLRIFEQSETFLNEEARHLEDLLLPSPESAMFFSVVPSSSPYFLFSWQLFHSQSTAESSYFSFAPRVPLEHL